MHLCLIDCGIHLPSLYMHCPRSSSGCSSMQGICAWLTGGSICLIYICIVLDLAVGVAVCKASVLDWLGSPSACYIYMHCPRSSSGCSGMQGICAWLTGGSICLSIYMHCPRSSNGCSSMQGICAQLTGEDLCRIALCYANIFSVVVFNAYMLDWLGDPSAFSIYALS